MINLLSRSDEEGMPERGLQEKRNQYCDHGKKPTTGEQQHLLCIANA